MDRGAVNAHSEVAEQTKNSECQRNGVVGVSGTVRSRVLASPLHARARAYMRWHELPGSLSRLPSAVQVMPRHLGSGAAVLRQAFCSTLRDPEIVTSSGQKVVLLTFGASNRTVVPRAEITA